MRLPSVSRTSTLPKRSRPTVTVSRSKNAGPSTTPGGGSAPGLTKHFAADLPAPLVHVKGLIGGLIHGLPIHARLPGRDPDAELDRDGHLGRPVQLVQRLPHARGDMDGVALVRVRH